MTGVKENLVEKLTCIVCQEAFDPKVHQPVALPGCGHTFCRPCVEKLQRRSYVLPCPTCRHPYKGEEAAHLPTNYLVLNLLPSVLQKEDKLEQMETTENFTNKLKEKFDPGPSKQENKPQEDAVINDENIEGMKKEININKKNLELDDSDMDQDDEVLVRRDQGGLHKMTHNTQGSTPENGPLTFCETPSERGITNHTVWHKDWRFWLLFVVFVVIMAAVGCGVALGCSMHVVNQLGFTSSGITRNSYASKLMSSTARTNKGVIPSESWVAWLQNAGNKGFQSKHQAIIGVLVALAFAVVGTMLFWIMVIICLLIQRRRHRKNEHYLLSNRRLPLLST
ncbi:uncharacterized protein LOC121875502 isoform X2 [Homarus americanus]|uniref:uncharacterized protein LOC121875502 isoform X2 n=1 Tax=Homarus americanus TaxID=6706 RepID=UPI001C47BFB6|nr:uncharacterized protein LOC121875502 isoform X2 [Homarus americanus]